MRSIVDFLEEEEVVRVTTSGVLDSLEQVAAFAGEALSRAGQLGVHRILIDHRMVTYSLSTSSIYRLPGTLRGVGRRVGTRTAILVTDGPSRDDFQFLETVLQNRGLVARLFHDYDEAITWLVADRDSARRQGASP
jgi:hypothetical protein